MHIVKYSPLPGLEKTGILAPIIEVTLINGVYEFTTLALVDSGAEQALISTVIAEVLNIDWKKIPRKIGLTTSGNFSFHPVQNIQAKIYEHEFRLNINVIEGINAFKCILGRKDIFKQSSILFEGFNNQFRINFRELN